MRLIGAEPIIEMLKRVRRSVKDHRRDLDLLNLQQLLECAPVLNPMDLTGKQPISGPTREKLAEEYLDICDHDCRGDQTVGIPACQFYEWPDMDGSGNPLPAGCKLKTMLEGVQK